jgi:hypothetical protein
MEAGAVVGGLFLKQVEARARRWTFLERMEAAVSSFSAAGGGGVGACREIARD